jgi:glycosyltransferase involved in cell wall biosynthesis
MKPASLLPITGSLLLGGSSTFLVNLSKAFDQLGLSLPILVLSEVNDHVEDFERVGHPVHTVAATHLIYEDRLAAGYKSLQPYQPRAVLACLGAESFEMLRLAPPGAARLAVIQSDDAGPYRAAQLYAPHLDAIVGVSQEIVRRLRSLPELARVRAEYIPYGVNFEPVVPERTYLSTKPLRVIYLGRLIEAQKRVSRLVDLVRQIRARQLPVEFTFAGSGPDEQALRAQLQGPLGVRFTGTITNQQARALLAEHDVMVLLSDYEGLPVSLLEAMGQGVVPIVSDLPSGIRDVVSNEHGYRVPVGDVCAAAEILDTLVRERARLRPLSERCVRLARSDYSAQRMAQRYLALIAQIAKTQVEWPVQVAVPPPLGHRPWLYRGVMRRVRRALKPLFR